MTTNVKAADSGSARNLPHVSLSILNWNGGLNTVACLEAIQALDYRNFDVVVVDNHSTDDSVEQIRNWFEVKFGERGRLVEYRLETALEGGNESSETHLQQVNDHAQMILIHSEDNRGFSGGHNLAIQYLLARKRRPDAAMLVNNDAILKNDCLTQLVEVALATGAGIVGASVFDRLGNRMIFGGRTTVMGQFFAPFLAWQTPPPDEADSWPAAFVGGEAMLIRVSALQDAADSRGAWFDERLFMYGEVLLSCILAARQGHETRMSRHAIVYHDKAQSSGGMRNPLLYYYPTRNRIHCARWALPLHLKLLFYCVNLAHSSIRVAGNYIKGNRVGAVSEFKGVRDGYQRVFGKWSQHEMCLALKLASSNQPGTP